MTGRTQPKRSRREPGAARAFAVVVETMRGEFRVFGEVLIDLTAKVSTGFEQVNGRLDLVEGRLGGVEGRLGGVEGRLDRVEVDVGLVKTAVLGNGRELKEMRAALDKKVDRDEVEGLVERVLARAQLR